MMRLKTCEEARGIPIWQAWAAMPGTSGATGRTRSRSALIDKFNF